MNYGKKRIEKLKKINLFFICWILLYLFVMFVNSSDNIINDMFGTNCFNYAFNYYSVSCFIGHNFLIILPLIIIIRNAIVIYKKKK